MKTPAEIEHAMRMLIAAAESAQRAGDPIAVCEIIAAHLALSWVIGGVGANDFGLLLDEVRKIQAAESN